VQYALMTETPMVIALVQRLGPSTGGATQGAQGDVLLAEFCTSGGFTIPMFAPASAAECYELTQTAFEWSERLRIPVVLLSDKEVGMTLEAIDRAQLPQKPVVQRAPHTNAQPFATYAAPCSEEPPLFAPVGGEQRVVATGSMHDAQGRLRKNTPEALAVLARLQTKISAHAAEMARFRFVPAEGASTLVISYGISARAAEEACRKLSSEGILVSFLQLQTLFYAGVIESLLGGRRLLRVNRVGGMIPPAQIIRAVKEAM
jgi:2-oxoglutarate ferredoxin oxidoreductase subunit alpha